MSDLTRAALSLLNTNDRMRAKDLSGYSFEWLPLAAGAANTKQSITIATDQDFVATKASIYVTDTAAPPVEVAAPQMTFNVSVGDRTIFDKNVHIRNGLAFGPSNSSSPFDEFPFPLYCVRGTTVNIFLSNLDGTNARNVRITLLGFLLWQTRTVQQSRGF